MMEIESWQQNYSFYQQIKYPKVQIFELNVIILMYNEKMPPSSCSHF